MAGGRAVSGHPGFEFYCDPSEYGFPDYGDDNPIISDDKLHDLIMPLYMVVDTYEKIDLLDIFWPINKKTNRRACGYTSQDLIRILYELKSEVYKGRVRLADYISLLKLIAKGKEYPYIYNKDNVATIYAQKELGEHYLNRYIDDDDAETGMYWYGLAAEAKDTDALDIMGRAYANGNYPVEKNEAKAFEYFKLILAQDYHLQSSYFYPFRHYCFSAYTYGRAGVKVNYSAVHRDYVNYLIPNEVKETPEYAQDLLHIAMQLYSCTDEEVIENLVPETEVDEFDKDYMLWDVLELLVDSFDDAESMEWIKQTADCGCVQSQGIMAYCLYEGINMPMNQVLAKKYYNLATSSLTYKPSILCRMKFPSK